MTSSLLKNKVSHRQRQGDWVCQSCNNMNFAFRASCNRCSSDRTQVPIEEKGFKSALFLIESNGDIPPFSDRSVDRSQQENNQINISMDKLPSVEILLLQVKNSKQSCKIFEFEWSCCKCSIANPYYKYQCNRCGYVRLRKLTA